MYLFFKYFTFDTKILCVCFGNVQENITFRLRANSDITFVCLCFGNVQENITL